MFPRRKLCCNVQLDLYKAIELVLKYLAALHKKRCFCSLCSVVQQKKSSSFAKFLQILKRHLSDSSSISASNFTAYNVKQSLRKSA